MTFDSFENQCNFSENKIRVSNVTFVKSEAKQIFDDTEYISGSNGKNGTRGSAENSIPCNNQESENYMSNTGDVELISGFQDINGANFYEPCEVFDSTSNFISNESKMEIQSENKSKK